MLQEKEKTNIQKTQSRRLGIGEDEQVILDRVKISRVDSFTFLGNIIGKDSEFSENVKVE